MKKEKFIKYILTVRYEGVSCSDWGEVIEISEKTKIMPEQIGKEIIQDFNDTLKSGEKRREFISIKLKSKRKK